MQPVRIRLYGLVSLTRRGYITQLTVGVVLLLVLLAIRLSLPPLPESSDMPHAALTIFLLSNLHWVVLVCGALLVLEAVIVLRRFKREEAKQGATAK